MTNKLIHWFDTPVDDIERAGQFYGTIFTIDLTHLEAPPDFVMKWFPSEGPHGGGVSFKVAARSRPAMPPSYFNGGDDLNTVIYRVEPAGGRVTVPKTGNY